MMRSMTGFVTGTVPITINDHAHAQLHIMIKSLNSRFFEATCRLPHQLTALETACIKRLSAKIRRGHLYVTMHIDNPALFKGTVIPAINVLESYIQAIDTIKQQYPIQGALTVEGLLQLPDIFYLPEFTFDSTIHDQILRACDDLADQLIAVQQQEGVSLAHDIAQRAAHMNRCITDIEEVSSRLIAVHKEKIAHMVQESTTFHEEPKSQTELNRQTAAYAALDKMDIHEEIVRFKMHLDSIVEQLQSPDIEKGKRLDFTLQELMREVNTITAKSCDATISKLAIDSKVELEKAREQAQNIV